MTECKGYVCETTDISKTKLRVARTADSLEAR